MIEGHGEIRWPNNQKYFGYWKENHLHGYGIYTYKSGAIYKGEFKMD